MANKLQIENMCYSAACVHVTLFVLECVHIKFNNYIVLDITWSVQDAQSLQLVTNLFTVILIPFQHLPTLGIVSKLVLEKKFLLARQLQIKFKSMCVRVHRGFYHHATWTLLKSQLMHKMYMILTIMVLG